MTTPLHLLPPQYAGQGIQSPSESPVQSPSAPNANPSEATQDVLLERSEIDRSLKSLEGLLSVLYDYAQVWSSLVSLDKKLAKALKEAGSMKRQEGVEWPGVLFSSSSQIFESVTECDSKFAKLLEREYESSNQELKKWLKKLKKEDKSLDDYCNTANAKLKSAQTLLNKSARKGPFSSPSANTSTAALQNLEYQTLLGQLSQSLAQAKHQHTLFISTRHISSLYTISGCIGRISDAQWMKTADALRRIAGVAGILGEARAYVEGGWRGARVGDLPLSLPVERQPNATPQRNDGEDGTIKGHSVVPTTATGGLPLSTPLETPSASKEKEKEKKVVDMGDKPVQAQETGGRHPSVDMLDAIRRELMEGGEVKKEANPKDPIPVRKPDTKPAPTDAKATTVEKSDDKSSKPNSSDQSNPNRPTTEIRSKAAEPSNTNSNSTGTNFSSSTGTSAKDTVTSISSKGSPTVPKTANPPGVEAPKPTEKGYERDSEPHRIPTPPTLSSSTAQKLKEEETLFAPRHALARTPLDPKPQSQPTNIAVPPHREANTQPTPTEQVVFEPRHALARTPLNAQPQSPSGPVNPSSPPTIFSGRKDDIPNNTPLTQQDPPRELIRPVATRPSQPQGSSYFPKDVLERQDTGGMPLPQHKSNASLPSNTGPSMPTASIPGYSGQIPGSFPTPLGAASPVVNRDPYGKPVNRTLSIDSTASNGSGMVAQLRERWNAASPPPPQSPHTTGPGQRSQGWRDAYARDADRYPMSRPGFESNPSGRDSYGEGRGGSRVQDMASRFTPIEGPLPPHSINSKDSTFQMGGGDRYRGAYSPPPVGRSRDMGGELPIRTPLKRSSVDEFGASFGPASGQRGAETMPLMNDRRHTMAPGLASRHEAQAPTPNEYGIQIGDLELQQREMELSKREMELDIQRQRLNLEREKEALMRERQQTLRPPGTPGDYGRSGTPGGVEFGRNNSGEFGRGQPGDYSRSGGYSSGTDFGSLRDRDGYVSDRPPLGAGGYRRNVLEEEQAYGGYNPARESPRDNREIFGRPYGGQGYGDYSSSPYQPRESFGTPRISPNTSYGREREDVDISSGLGVMGLSLPPSHETGPSSPSLSNTPAMSSLQPPSTPRTTNMDTKSRESLGVISAEESSVASLTGKEKEKIGGDTNAGRARKSADGAANATSGKEKGGTWLGKGLKRFSMA